jgi:hypothetical protein
VMEQADALPSGSLTGEAKGPASGPNPGADAAPDAGPDAAPDPGTDPSENQAPDSSTGAEVTSAQPEPSQPKDDTGFSTLAYPAVPALEMSMEASSDPIMYLQIITLSNQY